jgi:hypothetical protein
MVPFPGRPNFVVRPLPGDHFPAERPDVWAAVEPLLITSYLWLKNGYEPRVEIRLGYTHDFLYVSFRVRERRVRASFTRFQDPVYKDSCVEFFVDGFPEKSRGYLNIEANALGTMLIAFGRDRHDRRPLSVGEVAGLEVRPSLAAPVDGDIGADGWALDYRLPTGLFEGLFGVRLGPGIRAAANFYKCGDATEIPHYGAWSPVGTPTPDFHQPEYFGTLEFGA